MKKIEIIWRQLLYQAIEKGNRHFVQKDLAEEFGFSVSTVFQALKIPRKMGAVRVTGRYFTLEDAEKLLYQWANQRNFKKDIIFSARVELPVLEIEGNLPPGVVFAAYTAARHILSEPPADYDKVYIYAKETGKEKLLTEIKERFLVKKEMPNLFILKADNWIDDYGETTSLAQTFVDLWNLTDWYAKEFSQAIKEKIDELLS